MPPGIANSFIKCKSIVLVTQCVSREKWRDEVFVRIIMKSRYGIQKLKFLFFILFFMHIFTYTSLFLT